MANNYSINIRCSEHFRSLIRDSWLAQKEKEEKTGRDYPESVHIRMLLLAAMKKRGSVAPKPAVDESFAVIKEQIAKAWDEEMPPELPRISVKSSKRDQSLKARWSENSNIEMPSVRWRKTSFTCSEKLRWITYCVRVILRNG
jgi:hypothetical protein